MKQAKPTSAADALDAAIRDLMARPKLPELSKPPEGWKTICQWAQIIGKGKTATRNQIARLMESGQWEAGKFSIPTKAGNPLPTPHYRKKSS